LMAFFSLFAGGFFTREMNHPVLHSFVLAQTYRHILRTPGMFQSKIDE
jgi:hypothetical protein